MKIEGTLESALTGREQSNAVSLRLNSHASAGVDRVRALERRAKGRRILHVGCADHEEQIAAKMQTGDWLQARLEGVASYCLGVDTNAKAIAHLQEIGDYNVQAVQPNDFSFGLDSESFDLIIIGEVLEHIDNPVAFLEGLRTAWSGRVNEIVLTVPNAFYWRSILRVTRGAELINSDHRYWFTPYTISKVGYASGFEGVDIAMASPEFDDAQRPKVKQTVRAVMKKLLTKNPMVQQTIIASFEL